MGNRKNGFDLLRVILSIFVIITHGFLLGGYNENLEPLSYFSKNQTNLGEIAVMGFFALSGFLITASFDKSKNSLVFFSHRILRIFPGYWMCLIFTGIVIGPLIFILTGRSISNYSFLGNESAIGYFTHNFSLQIGQWTIKDVLLFTPNNGSLDGSFWSLLSEMHCYIMVVLLGYFLLFKKNRVLYFLVFIIILVFFSINYNSSVKFGPTFLTLINSRLKLFPSFFAGSIIYTFPDLFKLDWKGSLFITFFSLLLIKFGGFHLASPFLIALVIINLFQQFEFHLKYDISYGMYIYSFPIQHLLYAAFSNKLHYLVFIGLSILVSALLGFLSYLFIERPAMLLRKKTDIFFSKIKWAELKAS
ncbi:acyltransferase family protein [Parasediminibacterium sp. JCM 36343]|uniref:acyltransferase family protein n=1 Tax=Parasediminibacterium sp. JCM 36343 TaxID=3374279 RepID=UPI00397BB780